MKISDFVSGFFFSVFIFLSRGVMSFSLFFYNWKKFLFFGFFKFRYMIVNVVIFLTLFSVVFEIIIDVRGEGFFSGFRRWDR